MTADPDDLQLAFQTLEEVEAAWKRAQADVAAPRSARELEVLARRLVEVADEFATVSARMVHPSAYR